MTWAHAGPFRAAFILICTSRGWRGAALVFSPPEASWTSQSFAQVRWGDATTLIYYSGAYSWPVDLKTIELSCLRSQGCDWAVQDRLVALSRTERRENRQTETSDLPNWLFPGPAVVHRPSAQADYQNWPASFVVVSLAILMAKIKK